MCVHLCISYRMKLVKYLYILWHTNCFNPCVLYRLISVPISEYRTACHHFPTRFISSPAINSHLCLLYRLPSVPSLLFASPSISLIHISYRLPSVHISNLSLSYRLTPVPSLFIVSPAISSHFCLSYRMMPDPMSNIVSHAIISHLCISYRPT